MNNLNSQEMSDPYRIGRALNTPMHQITDYIYIGNRTALENPGLLKSEKIKKIVQLLDFRIEPDSFFDFLFIPLSDSEQENLDIALHRSLRFIHSAVLSKQRVLVHCNAGVSRSGSIVTAYLMGAYQLDFPRALSLVQEKRACVDPNPGFTRYLMNINLNSLRNMID
jgi:protein-tyrosine phosphatase